MKTLYLFIFLLISHISFAQVWDWTQPGPNGIVEQNNPFFENDEAHKVATDAQGFIYVLGDYGDSLYLNNIYRTKGNGSYVAKYDSTGSLIWYKLILSTNFNGAVKARDMVINSSGIFITGHVYEDGNQTLPVKYKIGTSSYTVDTSGYYNKGIFGEFFLCKINFDGVVNWNKTSKWANAYAGTGTCLTSDASNNIIISGFRSNPADGHGGLLPLFYLGEDLIIDNTSKARLAEKTFIIKYTDDGQYSWANFINDNGLPIPIPLSLTCDNNNNIWFNMLVNDSTYFGETLLTSPHMTYEGQEQVNTLSKLSSSGSFLFTNEISTRVDYSSLTSASGKQRLLACDNSNNLYVVVNLNSLPEDTPYLNINIPISLNIGQPELYILKYANTGSLIWYKHIGGTTLGNRCNNISYANEKLWFTGLISTKGSNYFSFPPLSVRIENSGIYFPGGYFVAKADTALNFEWVNTFRSTGPEGYSLAVLNNNIYTSARYMGGISDLGNLKGFTNPDADIHNQFLGKLKDQYIRIGAVTPTQLIPGCTITIPFTSYGLTFSSGNTFTAQLSDAMGDFTTPKNIGTTTSTGTGSITGTIPPSAVYGTGYRVRIRSSDTLKTGYNYYAYADTPYIIKLLCPPPSAGFATTNITGSSATVNWTAVGCALGYRVQYRVKGTTAWKTAGTLTTNISSFNLTGLTSNTTYQWRVASRCRNNGIISFSDYTTPKQFKTTTAFGALNTDDIRVNTRIELLIQPNPTVDDAVLSIKGNIKNATVSIVDFVGKTIWKKNGVKAGQLILPIQHFTPGTYVVKLVNGTETKIMMLIKQ